MFRRFWNWVKGKPEKPMDFGRFGILMVDPNTNEFRPMEVDDLMGLHQEANEAVESYWARLEWDAVLKHGRRILEWN